MHLDACMKSARQLTHQRSKIAALFRNKVKNSPRSRMLHFDGNQFHRQTHDGDLLLYNKDQQALAKVSASESVLRGLIKQYGLGIDDKKLRADLIKEKAADFPATQTYLLVRDVFARTTKQPVAFAEVPSIELNSPKIRHHMTTRNFADSVDKRYQKCVALKL